MVRSTDTLARVLLVAIAAVAAWSIAPPYLFPLDVADDVEVVDHVVPGLVALGAAAYAIALSRRGESQSTMALSLLGACALTGIWETLTHASLVLDTGDPGRPVGSALLHATPGPVLLGLSLWALLR